MSRTARLLASALVTGGCLAVALPAAADAAPAADSGAREIALGFQGLSGSVGDGATFRSTGSVDVDAVLHTNGGARASATRGPHNGTALQLPAFDGAARLLRMPLGVLTVEGSRALDPGAAPFEFGASFQLDENSGSSILDNGENLVQRGRFGAGSQYKLQVDHRRPSCRVLGDRGSVMVVADEAVQRDQWYDLECRRTATSVQMVLTQIGGDGSGSRSVWTSEGRTGSLSGLANSTPMTIGGKTTSSGALVLGDSDQFNGAVDNVFLDIED